MASVGTRAYDATHGCEYHPQVTHPHLGEHRQPRNNHLPAQIWTLERKNAHLGYGHPPVHFMVPSVSFPSEPSRTATPITPSPPRTPPRSLHDTLERTLVLHRQSIHQRPNKRIGSPLLKAKAEDQRPYSCRCPPIRPFLKSIRMNSAMTSSLVEQFPLPSAAGEPPELGIRRPSSVSPKQFSDASRPTLVVNSFLRPTSAKVPSPPQPDRRNQSLLLAGAKSASWHNGQKLDFGQPGGGVPVLNHNSISAGNVSYKMSSSSLIQGPAKTDDSTWQVNGKVTNIPKREVQLTEAVRRLAGKHLDSLPKPVCPKDEAFAKCDEQLPGDNFHTGFPNGNGPHSLTEENGNLPNANICIMDSNQSALNTSCHSTESSATSEPQLSTSGEISQRVNITVMASQISTIHLNRTSGTEANDRPSSAATDQESLVPNGADCAEEELPEGLDDSQDDEDEEDPDDPSIIQDSSAAMSELSRQCTDSMEQTADGDFVTKPAVTPNLFPNFPPTIYFGIQGEKVELLPWAQRKLLKWKMSTVTPNIVKQTVGRSHFRATKKANDWLGCWGHHMKSTAFKTLREHQKLNHFPGSFQIGRKDRLWRNLSKMQARFGRKEFNFFPQSFVLPQDIKLLRKAWEEGGTRQKWIVKPPASARGLGIQVIHKWSQLPKKRPLLVQRYLHKPYLISGSKFDLRIYVYVTSYDPLRVYLFTDGLVRFASCKYSSSMKSLSNKFMHLTNYSVNKKNADYKANADETACQGHKWALKALWTYLNQKGLCSDKIWEKIKEMVIKTIIASEPYVNSLVKMYIQNPRSCHELFGFDIMLDENLKPWVLEVNISPSLHSNSPLDVAIKGQMIRDLLNLAGFHLPSKDVTSCNATSSSSATSFGKERGRSQEVLNEEKMKRAFYLSPKLPDKDLYTTVLDQLTPEDVRVLAETEDELSRCGQFERVFPSPISSRYLRFFEQQRYFNILTNQWEQNYYNDREKGRELLRSLCLMNFHTGSVPIPHSPLKSSAQSTAHLNGFSRADVTASSKLLASPEEKSRCVQKSLFQEQQEPPERTLLSQSLANVSEPTFVM
ncbi:tubulin monoglutamylase TTLL4 [Hyperolius riggenbachi]|uniref:tubulin monoglutamylase TTLL4 n=1 Tax=Hyperolius riggenbachi TaxID=752182 RepID=UPI0035A35005